ncbi:protein of unknown function (plasmid) [Caballeronia sp. S22]
MCPAATRGRTEILSKNRQWGYKSKPRESKAMWLRRGPAVVTQGDFAAYHVGQTGRMGGRSERGLTARIVWRFRVFGYPISLRPPDERVT